MIQQTRLKVHSFAEIVLVDPEILQRKIVALDRTEQLYQRIFCKAFQ